MNLRKLLCGVAVAAAAIATSAKAADEITVAYFLEWPMPFQYAKEKGLYEEAMGVKINWVSFDTGTAMSAAMASGDVPRIGTCASSKAAASFNGVWPPNCTMTPFTAPFVCSL